jgi:translation initiation factor IF-2
MQKKNSNNLINRPPIVVVLGHVDHGKSTLLDYIRKSNVVSGEAGGITQHLGAYEVERVSSEGKKNIITFLDTPGHEAFTAIRERGAKSADIAILVVSAEDGVKPQTIEALKVIQKENIPYIVAINKIDKPEANIERTKQSLAENEIYVEGYGGSVPVVPISALTGKGIPELLDMIMLISDLDDKKADTEANATGLVIEAELNNKKGIGATLLIQNGTLKSGMYVVADKSISPVRIFEDFRGKSIKSASFSSPVKVVGFDSIPKVGSSFISFESKKEAEEYILNNSKSTPVAKINIDKRDDGVIYLPVIIKTDAIGSLDAVKHEIAKIKNDKVKIKIVLEGIGSINESDVKTAIGDPKIIILSFNAKPDSKASQIIERSNIKVCSFDIIYNLIEFIKKTVVDNVPKEYIEEATGTAKILALFSKTKDKQILGAKVQQGTILIGSEVKIIRREVEIGRGKIRELQEKKMKTSEVAEGHEFGTLVESKIEIAVGDKIQGFKVVEKVNN